MYFSSLLSHHFYRMVILFLLFMYMGRCVCTSEYRATVELTSFILTKEFIHWIEWLLSYFLYRKLSVCNIKQLMPGIFEPNIACECEFMYNIICHSKAICILQTFSLKCERVYSTRIGNIQCMDEQYIEKFFSLTTSILWLVCWMCCDLLPKYKRTGQKKKAPYIFRYKFWKEIEWIGNKWNENHLVICVVALS